jgi:hypothetical protein
MKCAWFFLLDKCDHAGIWIVDYKAMSFYVGEEISKEEIETSLQGKITLISPDKIYINSFIKFQYNTLNPASKIHKSVIDRLASLGFEIGLDNSLVTLTKPFDQSSSQIKQTTKPLPNPYLRVKDKEKEKDKVKVKDKEGGMGETITPEELADRAAFINEITRTKKMWVE